MQIKWWSELNCVELEMKSKRQDQVIVGSVGGVLGLEGGSVSVELFGVVNLWDSDDLFGVVGVFDDKFAGALASASGNGNKYGFDPDYNAGMSGIWIRLVSGKDNSPENISVSQEARPCNQML